MTGNTKCITVSAVHGGTFHNNRVKKRKKEVRIENKKKENEKKCFSFTDLYIFVEEK